MYQSTVVIWQKMLSMKNVYSKTKIRVSKQTEAILEKLDQYKPDLKRFILNIFSKLKLSRGYENIKNTFK